MATKDYAQDGTPSWQYWGQAPTPWGELYYINDGDDNSRFRPSRLIDGTESGTFEVKVQIPSRFMDEIKFITEVYGENDEGIYHLGFKLQYYNGSWQTLYTQPKVEEFNEAKTSRSYTNGGSGFVNVTYIRIWVEWDGQKIGANRPHWSTYIYSLILNSGYFPDSGLRLKTNDGLIGIGKDTALGTNKLRFYDGVAIQALPLQNVDSPYATKIRIYDGAAIKALTQVVT